MTSFSVKCITVIVLRIRCVISFKPGWIHPIARLHLTEQRFRTIGEGLDIGLVLIFDRQNLLFALNWQ